MPKYGVKYGVYCQKCDTPFIKYINNRILKKKENKTFLCKTCHNTKVPTPIPPIQKQIMDTLNNTDVDGYGWSYLYTSIYEISQGFGQGYDSEYDEDMSVQYEIQRFKKDKIKYMRDKLYFNCIQKLVQKLNGTRYHYSEEWYNSNPQGTFTHEWSLCLYNSYGYDYECSNSYETFKNDFIPISIKEAMEKPWGKDIIRKPYRNGLYRFILLRIYILRYIRHLRHIIWMPGSKAYKLLKYQFYERHKMNQIK